MTSDQLPRKIDTNTGIAMLAVLALLSSGHARAQNNAQQKRQAQAEFDADVCAQRTGSAAMDIVSCTRALNLGKHSALTTATLHNTRGTAYRVTGRISKALADHSAAIALNPLSADAYLGRALARIDAGTLGSASSDLEQAISLFPSFGFAWKHRGRIAFLQLDDVRAKSNFDQALLLNDADGEAFAFRALVAYRDGRFNESIADFEASRVRHLEYVYTPLWIYLAGRHLGHRDSATLDAGLAALRSDDEWPGILYKIYRGDAAADAALHQARQAPGEYALKRETEAAFYLGQLALADGDSAKAFEYFARVRDKAPPGSVERAMLP